MPERQETGGNVSVTLVGTLVMAVQHGEPGPGQSSRGSDEGNALRRYKVPRSDDPLGMASSQALLRSGSEPNNIRRFLTASRTSVEI